MDNKLIDFQILSFAVWNW